MARATLCLPHRCSRPAVYRWFSSSKASNVPVIVDNRPGAGGNIGSDAEARSARDSYTLPLATVATHGINASLYKNLPNDPVKDLAPVSLVASSPSVLEVNRLLPINSVSELIAYAKQNLANVEGLQCYTVAAW
ncbi:tripartite tricarboxylate transporter substrate-binding protein [Bradyrhizobium neotropicale]|uniref:tripartite tricarboxylate transporter substrate-binding protein n=1 Tax=Bradyrhizobium neotropicale TaxID=1497615 RepID=UPI000AB4002B